MTVCTYTGSYYDPAPWTESACVADEMVPAGCPVHFVIGTQLPDGSVTADRVGSGGTTTPLASTTTLVDTVTQTFSLPDEFSCDCAPTETAIGFSRYAVAVPGAKAGDVIGLEIGGISTPFAYQIVAAGPCPAPDWPTDYEVALACDRCPGSDVPPDGGLPGDPVTPPEDHGCAVGGAPGVLAALLLLPLARRRRVHRRGRS